MSWPRVAALSIAVAVLAPVAAGCGNSGHSALTATAGRTTSSVPCRLSRVQRRAVARALADIRRLRRIEAPVQTYSERGAPNEVAITGTFELDLGSAHLPLNVFSHLLHLAKTATRLCGDCGRALEAEEPVLGNRSGTTHAQEGGCG